MSEEPIGANVGHAWVALRFSARGAKQDIAKQVDEETNGVGTTAGKKVGEDLNKSVKKETAGLGKDVGKSLEKDLKTSTKDIGKNIGQSISNGFTDAMENASPALLAIAGAGVALSPVIATLSTGFAGLGVAAASTVPNIIAAAGTGKKAAQAFAELDPAQRKAVGSLKLAETAYKSFGASLEPQVLTGFNEALSVGKNLLNDIQPVTKAVGTSFDQFISQFGNTLQDSQFQQFWSFMAQTAPGDMKLVGNLIINLANDMPTLIRAMQPVAQVLLTTADGLTKVAEVGGSALNMIHAVSNESDHGTGKISALATAVRATVDAAIPLVGAYDVANSKFHVFGKTAQTAQGSIAGLVPTIESTLTPLGRSQLLTAEWATAQKNLNTAISKGITPLTTYIQSTVTQKDDQLGLVKALKQSHDHIGLNTAAQRNSLSTAENYINDLASAAQNALNSGHGIDAQRRAIKNALPLLDSVKGKTKAYNDQLTGLHGLLGKLAHTPNIAEKINITGLGTWSASTVGSGAFSGKPTGSGAPVRHASTGWRVPGSGYGDTVPAMLTPGEAVVPKRLVPAVAPFLSANNVPGFATGGIVPDYKGKVGGLSPWTWSNNKATIKSITDSIGNKMAKQFAGLFASSGKAGAGVQQWAGVVHEALAMLGLSQALAGRVLYQMQTESGGNPAAINLTDSNALAGDPSRGLMQVIGSTFAAYHVPGTSGNIYNPLANVAAALNYAEHRYGPSLMSGGMGIGSGHGYDSGGIANGMGYMPKRTIKPERVLSPKQTNAFERLVDALDGRAGSRKIHITGGTVNFDPSRGEMYIRDLAAEEATDAIAFASR